MASPSDITLAGPATDVSPELRALFGPFLGGPDALRLTIGDTEEQGFVRSHLDRFDRDWTPASCACVFAPRVLHRVPDLVALMEQTHRVLMPGGYLIVVSPYASSDDAWEDPRTVRAFTEHTWVFFASQGFLGAHLNLVPMPDLQLGADGLVGRQAELQVKKRFMRNVIQEMHVVLRKVEA